MELHLDFHLKIFVLISVLAWNFAAAKRKYTLYCVGKGLQITVGMFKAPHCHKVVMLNSVCKRHRIADNIVNASLVSLPWVKFAAMVAQPSKIRVCGKLFLRFFCIGSYLIGTRHIIIGDDRRYLAGANPHTG